MDGWVKSKGPIFRGSSLLVLESVYMAAVKNGFLRKL